MSDNTPIKVSVIIPMYFCEDFVQEMLSAMSAQTLEEIEVICVIDGSDDRTEEIVKEHCEKDRRFSCVYQKNGGAGKARNTGLDIAKGKYVIFLDADDEYSLSMLEELYTAAERNRADIAVCSFTLKNYGEGTTQHNLGFSPNVFSGKECGNRKEIKRWIVSFWNRLTNKLYRRDFLKKHGLRCSETKVGNDIFLDIAALFTAEVITVIRHDLLTVRRLYNQESITSKSCKNTEETFTAYRQLWEYLEKWGMQTDYIREYCYRFIINLSYRSGLGYNPVFINEAARTICEEKPWNEIGTKRFRNYCISLFNPDDLYNEKTEAEQMAAKEKPVQRKTQAMIETLQNKLLAIKEIKRICKEKYGKDVFECKTTIQDDERLNVADKDNAYYIYRHLPEKVRLEASTICQLRCAECGFQKGGKDDLGRGYLTIDNFKRFVEMNPFVREIELSNYGEIFLNPDLVKIMYEAKRKGIALTAGNGTNFNTVSDEQMLAMVETGFKIITLSIDGASQETYSKYRIRGNYDVVMENVRKLQELKKKHGTVFPKLIWQYILMEHNELEVGKAKEIAKELGIPIKFKLTWDKKYKPVNREYLIKETGLKQLTRTEFSKEHKVSPKNNTCNQLFFLPQINWDGRLIGCCCSRYATFDVNVFEVGLEAALRSTKYITAKKCVLTLNPDPNEYSSCLCYDCDKRKQRESSGLVLELKKGY